MVHAPRVAVRSSPSTSGAIVGSRLVGEEFPVVEEAGGWVKVVHGGREAWMLVDGSTLGLGLLLSALPQLDTPLVTRVFSLALAVQLPSPPAGAGVLRLRVQTLGGGVWTSVSDEHGPFKPAARERPVDVRGLRPAQRVRLRAEASGGCGPPGALERTLTLTLTPTLSLSLSLSPSLSLSGSDQVEATSSASVRRSIFVGLVFGSGLGLG